MTVYPAQAPASEQLFARAVAVTPGGVNSPVRAFRAVGGTPRFMASGKGAFRYDADGREYVDLVCSWGPMILGHAHPEVLDAVRSAAAKGFSFGTPTESEVLLAEELVARVAPLEQVRLVSSGTCIAKFCLWVYDRRSHARGPIYSSWKAFANPSCCSPSH